MFCRFKNHSLRFQSRNLIDFNFRKTTVPFDYFAVGISRRNSNFSNSNLFSHQKYQCVSFSNSTKIFNTKIANDIKNNSKIELNDDDIDDDDDDNNLIEKSETVVKKPKPRRKTKRQSPGARILSIFRERLAEETKPKIKFCRSTILKLGNNHFFFCFCFLKFQFVSSFNNL